MGMQTGSAKKQVDSTSLAATSIIPVLQAALASSRRSSRVLRRHVEAASEGEGGGSEGAAARVRVGGYVASSAATQAARARVRVLATM